MLVLSKGILLLSLPYVLLIHTLTWTILDVYGKSPVRFASASLFITCSIVLFADGLQ
jgi:hypothetical protein